MGRTAKNIIKYRGEELPENLSGVLDNADENDLKILIALMMAANEQGELPADTVVSEALGIEKADVTAAIKFWRGAGIIVSASSQKKKETQAAPEEVKKSEPEKPAEKVQKPESAHRGGALESADTTGYKTAELADIFEKRAVTAEFIDEAQRVFGKIFNSNDTAVVVRLIDDLGFEEEAVLAILAYVISKGKKGVRYAEKMALSFYDMGYTTASEVIEQIEVREKATSEIGKIKSLYGIGARELTKSEKAHFEKWTQKFGYGIDIIRLAYDITVDTIREPQPRYTSAILEKWFVEGLRTLEDIENFETSKKKDKSGESEAGKSYDLDEFFEAALQRSFDELN